MKYLIIIMALGTALIAGELPFEHDFHTALQKAKSQNKEVMMMYSATWCPECNYMKEVVFKNKEVAEYIQKHFIVLSLDIQKDTLPEGFKYIGIPTFFFIDENATEKDRIVGGDKADKFLKNLKEIK
ncbi:thioredoxin family protein [Sulfurovum sp. NBC37-1]|uniref:thioredoxin family protein n=1 Tax=Sulfurovum sp. (strain NBC37-1) TaxID=387093 RepID=UPI0011D08192|nr:thioredoxin family protein [Sulfurovum sp. NBC37-1]